MGTLTRCLLLLTILAGALSMPVSLMSDEEFSSLLRHPPSFTPKGHLPVEEEEVDPALPIEFDARDKWDYCIHGIRDQAKCGSCFAFATAEVVEDRYCIVSAGKFDKLLSAQYIVSCDKEAKGCDGGDPEQSFQFVKETGVCTEQCFPYESMNGTVPACLNATCKDPKIPLQLFKISEYKQYKGEEAIKKEILEHGPVHCAFEAYVDFKDYQTGIYTLSSSSFRGTHSIKIIGWGLENGIKYWICQNSWGNLLFLTIFNRRCLGRKWNVQN